jgi:hypothetical protein
MRSVVIAIAKKFIGIYMCVYTDMRKCIYQCNVICKYSYLYVYIYVYI